MVMKKINWNEINQAYKFAEQAHRGQTRKNSDEPYFNHPVEVMFNILQYVEDADTEMLISALTHDVPEDCEVTFQDMTVKFGPSVASIVNFCTKISVPEDGDRATRKKIDQDHYAKGNYHSQNVKVADAKSNTRDLLEMELSFAKKYIYEKIAMVEALTKANAHLREVTLNQMYVIRNQLEDM